MTVAPVFEDPGQPTITLPSSPLASAVAQLEMGLQRLERTGVCDNHMRSAAHPLAQIFRNAIVLCGETSPELWRVWYDQAASSWAIRLITSSLGMGETWSEQLPELQACLATIQQIELARRPSPAARQQLAACLDRLTIDLVACAA